MKIVLDPNPSKCLLQNNDGSPLELHVKTLELRMDAAEIPQLTLYGYAQPGTTVQIDGADITVIGVDTDEDLHPDS